MTKRDIAIAVLVLICAALACSRDLRIDSPGLWCIDTDRDGVYDVQVEVCPGTFITLPPGTAVWRCGEPVNCPAKPTWREYSLPVTD